MKKEYYHITKIVEYGTLQGNLIQLKIKLFEMSINILINEYHMDNCIEDLVRISKYNVQIIVEVSSECGYICKMNPL